MWRYIAAIAVIMIFVVAVVIFADYGSYGGYIGEHPYQAGVSADATSLIQVEVDQSGGIHITPQGLAQYISMEMDQYGNILLLLPDWIKAHDIDLTLPYGWAIGFLTTTTNVTIIAKAMVVSI